jgi:DNA-binding NtrC family response regulator
MPAPRPNVLVVDRASAATTGLLGRLRAQGMHVTWAKDDEGARRALAGVKVDGVIVALRARGIDGMALLRRARADHPAACVVLTTDAAGMRRATRAMRDGAWDALLRPVDPERLIAALDRGLLHQRLLARVAALEDGAAEGPDGDPFIGRSRAIGRVIEQVRHLAATHAAVLVEGEPGTGKGAVARAIHRLGPGRDGPFVSIDCSGGGPVALEQDLFGVEAPDADARPGGLERADGGTLYLDEVAATPQAVQIRLLRLLQDRAFERVGGRTTIRVEVRLIAGTARDIGGLAREGLFRDDLLRRLAAARIAMPPLRERGEDIPPMVERFLRDANRRHRRRVRSVTRGVLEILQRHAWPGNVRELRDTVESMVVSAPGGRPLDLAELPRPLRSGVGAHERVEIAPGMTVEEAERALIASTLAHVGHDKPRAAAMLGIGLRTLYRKIKEYGIA